MTSRGDLTYAGGRDDEGGEPAGSEVRDHFQSGMTMEQMQQDDLNLANQLFFANGDPHAVWKRLRAEDPVHWTDGGLSRGFWSVTKLEDVQAVYRDAATFKSGYGLPSSPEMEQFDADPQRGAREKMLVQSNPPFHPGLRKAFVAPFLQRAVTRYAEPGRKIVAELVDEVLPRGECDFVMDVAAKLPMAIICDMMQVPRTQWGQMFRWANMAMAAEDPEYQIKGGAPATKTAGYTGIFNYVLQLALERRGNPGDDLLSLISNCKVDGRLLTEEEAGHNGFMFADRRPGDHSQLDLRRRRGADPKSRPDADAARGPQPDEERNRGDRPLDQPDRPTDAGGHPRYRIARPQDQTRRLGRGVERLG